MDTFSDAAITRSERTVQAAAVLREHAELIASFTAVIQDNEIVAATVQDDLTFAGLQVVARDGFIEELKQIEQEGGWSLTFTAHTTLEQIEEQCERWSQLAAQRGAILKRRAQRQSGSDTQG